jgi:hypothetical protein
MHHVVDDFRLGERAMRYSLFVPRLYNYCLSLGFRRERMMPSRAFCSDESQGYPVILLMQHFGTFPFDHGLVGGRVAVNRHGPHAHHGDDLVIIQASHVGYDPASGRFGTYPRPRTSAQGHGDNCGKLCATLRWYQDRYEHAGRNVILGLIDNEPAVFIDNLLLNDDRTEGLFLRIDRLIAGEPSNPLKTLPTSKAFRAAPRLVQALSDSGPWPDSRAAIGVRLSAETFYFRRNPVEDPEGHDLLEAALAPMMPALVTSPRPALDAARYHTQVEFDRAYRSIESAPEYRGKKLLLVAGLNIDIGPPPGMPFPLTKFIPWAAYSQLHGENTVLEQDALVEALVRQPATNSDQMSFDAAIEAMAGATGVSVPE